MKKIVLVLALLSLNAFAGTVNSLKSADECKIKNTPSYFPTYPRAIEGTNVYGKVAKDLLAKILASNNYKKENSSDLLFDQVSTYSLELSKEVKTNIDYPIDGCTASAILRSSCLVDEATSAVKCGQVCDFDISCIDNR